MQRAAGYNESWQLTQLIEELRERLGNNLVTPAPLHEHLEGVLGRLLTRNQRLRVLHRLSRGASSSQEHIEAMRNSLEQLDAQLLRELPDLLEHLRPVH
jgi:hypothetical protein